MFKTEGKEYILQVQALISSDRDIMKTLLILALDLLNSCQVHVLVCPSFHHLIYRIKYFLELPCRN